MTNVQERLLESKMTEVEQARSWSPRVISKFETLIRSGDDLSLYRINPLAFARDRAISEAESIDLFLHATRSGLFEMSWDVVCPQSGMVLDSFGALRTLKTHYVCGLCDVTGDTDLDDFIEVTFTVSPQLRRLPFHDPDSLSVEDFHWKLRFLNDGRIPGQQVRFLDIVARNGSRPCVPAARLHHHASGRPRSRCSVGRQHPDASRVHGADPRRARDDADRLARSNTMGSAFLLRWRLCRLVPS